ncbi:methylmalonyl-CoA epimerase [Aquimarina intermedia]|uniref:Methylmalonyl-CoA epimerase n=2 Tax=Aquimarina intermedia TaxID=350814 RepID=A0A5S5CCF4_9FLAO|nr:methylmalonyl-CoA epimerase [Aquimarina intermedia]
MMKMNVYDNNRNFTSVKYKHMNHINKIEHLGIAVKDLDTANKLYEKLLGVAPYKKEVVESEAVTTSFFQVGESKIELLASTDENGPIGKFITKKGEGIHHIAFDVSDIKQELKRLKDEGFQLINEEPKRGADNKLVAFIHPKSSNGVLIELCQEISK